MTRNLQQLILRAALVAACGTARLYSQAPAGAAKPQPDVLIFTDGEKLIGQLKSAKGDSVVFKSDMAGEITVAWNKIQELRTSRPFAVIAKNAKLRRHADVSQVPQGDVVMTDQKIAVEAAAGAPRTVPVGDAGFLVAQPDFEKAMNREAGFFHDWGGTVTAGASIVQATQAAYTYTGAIALVRTEPTESWMDPSTRTLFDFSAAYGKVSQPGLPDIKTAIFHGDAEEDKYFSPRLFGFGQAAFDHNYSQGLDLQQMYGGGVGWTAYKTGAAELDLKAAVSYIHQGFSDSAANESLIGSTFAEIYTRKFQHGILFNQQFSTTPAWNDTDAYFATGSISLTLPVHKRFSMALTSADTFLNDPPPGFRKNSFQFTAGLTYALK
ncbi:MAG TPA: DUF481 domain-containing protein [Bryobacteraceae bacterium]|nr:DUF481 domain-containing protein [Bryobacteraceae bacterium]